MNLKELFSEGVEKPLGYLRDLGDLVFSPRRFLRRAADEDSKETFRRLATYALAFAFVELATSAFALGHEEKVSAIAVAAVAMLEVPLSLFQLPSLLAVAWLLREEKPLKVSLVYAISYRCAFAAIPMLVFALFLLTEDYTVAPAKGITVWAVFFGSILTFPLALARTTPQRARALGLSLVLSLAINFAIGEVSFWRDPVGHGLQSMSFLRDPIGAEVDRARIRYNEVGVEGPFADPSPAVRAAHYGF